MAPARQVSHRQLEMLVDFAEENKAINRLSNYSPANKLRADKAWENLANILNSNEDEIKKTPLKWKRYWHLLKCRTKAKAADARRIRCGTASGLNKIPALTNLEQRIVRVIGETAVARHSAVISWREGVRKKGERKERERKEGEWKQEEERKGEEEMKEEEERNEEDERNGETERKERERKERERKVRERIEREKREAPAPMHNARNIPDRGLPGHTAPIWAVALERRRIAVEERLADAVASIAATNKGILESLQHIAATTAQLVSLQDPLHSHQPSDELANTFEQKPDIA